MKFLLCLAFCAVATSAHILTPITSYAPITTGYVATPVTTYTAAPIAHSHYSTYSAPLTTTVTRVSTVATAPVTTVSAVAPVTTFSSLATPYFRDYSYGYNTLAAASYPVAYPTAYSTSYSTFPAYTQYSHVVKSTVAAPVYTAPTSVYTGFLRK